VNIFKYLGSLVTVDSNNTTDIKASLTIARHATLQLRWIWETKDIGMDIKKQLVRSLFTIWTRKLGTEEASDAENQLDRTENNVMDSGKDWYTRRKRHLRAD